MKLTFGFLIVLAIGVRAQKPEIIFQRTFRRLHEEPPPPPASTAPNASKVQTLFIEQKLDHFNESEKRTWQMRYMANDKFYVEGGPFFIEVGGEWEISSDYVTGGHTYDMAKEHSGYLFYTEHRYYGQSRPTSDLSVENLKYLTVRQALADLAHFIRTMRATLPGAANSKVILVGASYAGTMVTWFKREYPDLAVGCWAASAPLLAKVDFPEYKEVAGESIALVGGTDCYNRIQNGIAEMESMLASKRGAEVKSMLNLCDNFDGNNELDMGILFNFIFTNFSRLVETHNDGNIQRACHKIMKGEDDVTGVIGYLATFFNPNSCNDLSYKTAIAVYKEIAYVNTLTVAKRQWTYQTCNEFGWLKTSGSMKQPFGTKAPLRLFTTICRDAYGDQFTNETIYQKVAETNKYFGGLNPDVNNVYFTYGQLDPWHAVGLQTEGQATVLPMYTHCQDLGPISTRDSAEMRASKEKIAELVRQWLSHED